MEETVENRDSRNDDANVIVLSDGSFSTSSDDNVVIVDEAATYCGEVTEADDDISPKAPPAGGGNADLDPVFDPSEGSSEEEVATEQIKSEEMKPVESAAPPNLPLFCKVQEPGTHDPPRFFLVPLSDFVHDSQPSLEKLIQAVSLNFEASSAEWSLQYADKAGDRVSLSSDTILQKALTESAGSDELRLWAFKEVRDARPCWPATAFQVVLVTSWQDKMEASLGSHRLLRESDGPESNSPKPEFAKLVEFATRQFNLPEVSFSFSSVDTVGQQHIACDEDLIDAAGAAIVDGSGNNKLVIKVDLVLATVTRISYPTHDNKRLSRRVPLQSLMVFADESESEMVISYDKLLLTVADSLGSSDFVLTYTPATAEDEDEEASKCFITCSDDFLDALRQFPAGELLLVPLEVSLQASEAHSDAAAPMEILQLPTGGRDEIEMKLSTEGDENIFGPKLSLSYQGREASRVILPLDSIMTNSGDSSTASYWCLFREVCKAFHLGSSNSASPPPVCLFYVSQDGAKAEVASDAYLRELVELRIRRLLTDVTPELHIRVEPAVLSLATVSNGVSLRNFSLSHILYNDRHSVSFAKLVRLGRTTDPIIGLVYRDIKGVQAAIGTDEDLATALHQFPRGDLLIQPRIQDNPFPLSVRDAALSGKKCRLGAWTTPNIMLKSDNAMGVWDISMLVPGRYRISTMYWRDLNQGPVSLSIGVVANRGDVKSVTRVLSDVHLRHMMLSQVKVQATGLAEADFSKATSLGEFDFKPMPKQAPETCFFVVSAAPQEDGSISPDVYVSDIQLTYLGPPSDAVH